MAELLLKVDPACIVANEIAGQIVAAQDDGFAWSLLERKLFVVVSVPMTKEDAEAKFLATGVPDDVVKAEREAMALYIAAVGAKDAAAEQIALDARAAARYAPTDHPDRRHHIDVSFVPQEAVQAVIDTRSAIEAVRPQIDVAVRAALEAAALQSAFDGAADVIGEVPSREIKRATERVLGDVAVDALHDAERAVQFEILQPVLDAALPYPVVVFDEQTLADATVERTSL